MFENNKLIEVVTKELESEEDWSVLHDIKIKKAFIFKPIFEYFKKINEKINNDDLDISIRFKVGNEDFDINEEHVNSISIEFLKNQALAPTVISHIGIGKNKETNKVYFWASFLTDYNEIRGNNDSISYFENKYLSSGLKKDKYGNIEFNSANKLIEFYDDLINNIIVKEFSITGNLLLKHLSNNWLIYIFTQLKLFYPNKDFEIEDNINSIKLKLENNSSSQNTLYISPLYNGDSYRIFISIDRRVDLPDNKIKEIMNDKLFIFNIYTHDYRYSLYDRKIIFELVGFREVSNTNYWSLSNESILELIINIIRLQEHFFNKEEALSDEIFVNSNVSKSLFHYEKMRNIGFFSYGITNLLLNFYKKFFKIFCRYQNPIKYSYIGSNLNPGRLNPFYQFVYLNVENQKLLIEYIENKKKEFAKMDGIAFENNDSNEYKTIIKVYEFACKYILNHKDEEMPGRIYSPEILIENFVNIDNAKLDYNLFCETIKK